MAPDPQNPFLGGGADEVGGIAFILSRVRVDVKVDDGQFGVAVLTDDEEAARGVVHHFHTGAVINFPPAPLWIRITHGFAEEDGSLPLILILTVLVCCDFWSSFYLNGGICLRGRIKRVHAHILACIICLWFSKLVLCVFGFVPCVHDLLSILHPEALTVAALGSCEIALKGD